MGGLPETLEAGRALWAAAIDPEAPPLPCEGEALRAAAARFAWRAGPTTAAWLLQPLLPRLPALADPEETERARQLIRFMRASALKWIGLAGEAGIEVMPMKGFASATRFYPDPMLRAMSDVDLLVRPGDVARLCTLFTENGFRFVRSSGTPVWGLSGEASFHPLVAGDGAISFDLHVAADDYPVPRGLGIDEVFARARRVDIDGVPLMLPCDDDIVLLAITHGGRDKFGPGAMRAVTDLVVALARADIRPDWGALWARARRGGFTGAVVVAAHLLKGLGIDEARLPRPALRPLRGLSRLAFGGILDGFLTVFEASPSRLAMQARDWVLISSPRTLVHRNGRRIAGLLRPWPGVPEGFSVGG